MQGTLVAVLVRSVVIVKPVGQSRILLYFAYKIATAYSVHGTRRDEQNVSLFDLYKIQIFGNPAFSQSLFEFVFADRIFKSAIYSASLFAIDNVPHLRLSVLTLIGKCVFIAGVHLNGKVALAVDKLYKYGEKLEFFSVFSQKIGIAFYYLRKFKVGVFTIYRYAFAFFVTGKLPAFGNIISVGMLIPLIHKLCTAPHRLHSRGD